MKLTICYLTGRHDPKIEWFFDSLHSQMKEIGENPNFVSQVIIVNRWQAKRTLHIPKPFLFITHHVAAKPCVWQGEHRLTKDEYFAAANTRNTALCYATGDYLAYVDDLSVLMPGWLNSVREAIAGGYVAFGAYKKVKNLIVEDGLVVSCDEWPGGVDSRWTKGADHPISVTGDWLYGCSLAGPTEAFLSVNGWDENCDACGVGSEDTMMGIRLGKRGYRCKYDRRMLTYESDELHHVEPPLKRVIQKQAGREDASWAILNMVRSEEKGWAPNYFGEGGIRALRDHILKGGQFPVMKIPDRDWYSGKLLSEL